MSTNTIDSESKAQQPASEAQAVEKARKPKAGKTAKKAKAIKKARRPNKAAAKPKADRTNKKVEVIAMMKRAKGATLAEIMIGITSELGNLRYLTRKWQPETPVFGDPDEQAHPIVNSV